MSLPAERRLFRRGMLALSLFLPALTNCSSSDPHEKEGDDSPRCARGNERCDCYPNDTCNGDLVCRSGLCVEEGPLYDNGNGGGPTYDVIGSGGANTGGVVVGVGGTETGGAPSSGDGGAPETGGEPGAGGDPGTGGEPGSGGAGTGGAPNAPLECAAVGFEVSDGYADNGQMCGYASTGAWDGATVEPPCGADQCFTGDALCATGAIPAESDELGVFPGISIRWNVAQDSDGGVAGTWTPIGAGLTATFTKNGALGVSRLSLFSGGVEYCANVGSGVAVPWSAFTVNCWEAGGASFPPGSPIQQVTLSTHSTSQAQTVSNFCLESLVVN